MSMSSGTKSFASEINVTPLIDILLVLLIIFMVIVPATPRGMNSLVPQPPKDNPPVVEKAIVVQVEANGAGEPSYLINQTRFPKSQLVAQLSSIFATRQEKVMFVKGYPSLEFKQIAEVIDFGHEANVDSIGLITPRIGGTEQIGPESLTNKDQTTLQYRNTSEHDNAARVAFPGQAREPASTV